MPDREVEGTGKWRKALTVVPLLTAIIQLIRAAFWH